VIEAARRAVKAGYTIALDDFEMKASWAPLLELAQMLGHDAASLALFIAPLKSVSAPQAARRTRGERVPCARCAASWASVCIRATTSVARKRWTVARSRCSRPRSFQSARAAQLDPERHRAGARGSVPQSSVAVAVAAAHRELGSFGGRGVESIPHAIRLVGREALSRWMLIMLVASVGARSAVAHEAVAHALVRGRFCERSPRTGRAAIRRRAFSWGCSRAWTCCSACPWRRCSSACR
jgi:c-di-GMP phosphodiesterase